MTPFTPTPASPKGTSSGCANLPHVETENKIRWSVVARESTFDQFKLDLSGQRGGSRHRVTRLALDRVAAAFSESDALLVEMGQESDRFDFTAGSRTGHSVCFLLRSRSEGQFLGTCRFGLHKTIFEALGGVGDWWELRSGKLSSFEIFRKLLNRVSDGIAELDADDRIRWVNAALKRALPETDWSGGKLSDIVREGDQVRLQALREQHATGVVVPFAVHLPNGERVVLDPSPWFDESGRFAGTSLVFRQVHESVQEESRAEELFCLYALASALGRATTVEEALEVAVQRSVELLKLAGGGSFLLQPEGLVSRQTEAPATSNSAVQDHFRGVFQSFPSHKKALVERVLTEQSPLVSHGIQGYTMIPLELGEGRRGALWFVSVEQGAFPRETVSLLISAAQQLSVILENLFYTQERIAAEHDKRRFYRDALCAVTGGKLMLCERSELDEVWQAAGEDLGEIDVREPADVPASRHFLEKAVGSVGLTPEKVADLALCSTEAVGNVVKHAEQGSLKIRCNDSVVTVRVEDVGPGIDFAQLPNAVLSAGYSTAPSLGMGYSILLEMMDRVYLSTQQGGTWILLELQKAEADPLEAFAHLFAEDDESS